MKRITFNILFTIVWPIVSFYVCYIYQHYVSNIVKSIYGKYNPNLYNDVTFALSSGMLDFLSLYFALFSVLVNVLLISLFKSKINISIMLGLSILVSLTLYIFYIFTSAIIFDYESFVQLPTSEPSIFAFIGTVVIGLFVMFYEQKSANKLHE